LPVATFAHTFYHPFSPFPRLRLFGATIVPELKVVFSREQIAARVAELGRQISTDFAGEAIVLVGVLKGAAIFLSDLSRQIELDSTFDFIAVSTYGDQKQSSGEVKLLKDVDQSMEGRNVILVEDILDTGLTLCYLKKMILAHRPKAFRIAALLDKKCRRLQPIEADYTGFVIPDDFVVGYGMDYAERFRNLPDICVVCGGVALP
jgi:hypoxanthine phosphoribosyltransferase